MDFKQLCEARYSCRLYADTPVSDADLEYVLDCARLAPSAVNKQPWKVKIARKPAELEGLWAAYDREWFRTAPVIIAVIVDNDAAWHRQCDGKCHADIDGAIFTEHLCLAAASIGLGTCWICNFDPATCRQALDLAPSQEVVALVPIGYPADSPKPKSRKSLSDIQ